jgi:hypothetical protein
MMNYSKMAMVWAEIVLHKDVDWRTVYGRNVSGLNWDLWMIPTNWIGPSDCWPRWSNRMSNSGVATQDRVFPHYVPNSSIKHSKSDSKDRSQEILRNTIRIGPSPTTLPRHSAQRMKEEAMDMIIIHTTALGTTPPQHSLFHMEAQAMAMTTVHTTLRGMILTHHLVWRMKGEVMAMTTDCIIQLLTPLPPRSVMPMNSQAATLTTIRIIVSQTILLRLSAYM